MPSDRTQHMRSLTAELQTVQRYLERFEGAGKVDSGMLLKNCTELLPEERARLVKSLDYAGNGTGNVSIRAAQAHLQGQQRAHDLFDAVSRLQGTEPTTPEHFQAFLNQINFPSMIGVDIILSIIHPEPSQSITEQDFILWMETCPVQFSVAYECCNGVMPDRGVLEGLLAELNTLSVGTEPQPLQKSLTAELDGTQHEIVIEPNGELNQSSVKHLVARELEKIRGVPVQVTRTLFCQEEHWEEVGAHAIIPADAQIHCECRVACDSDQEPVGSELMCPHLFSEDKLHAYAKVIKQQRDYLNEICDDHIELPEEAVLSDALQLAEFSEVKEPIPQPMECFARRGTAEQGYKYSSRRVEIDSSRANIVLYSRETVTEVLPLEAVNHFSVFLDPSSQFSGPNSPPGWSLLYIGSQEMSRVLAVPTSSLDLWTAFVASQCPGVVTEPVHPPLPYPAETFAASPKRDSPC
eukprot:TRINITY_DN8364_c1_g2_i2.p1 TRINITY_DN8364_c1_g2~~TRINITY_DN8364_c1_g2_i2.p1  ORF type:complete len:466 (+),score=41.00 TRINITY_DN8364_c1_g2_i2:164-1561(+)